MNSNTLGRARKLTTPAKWFTTNPLLHMRSIFYLILKDMHMSSTRKLSLEEFCIQLSEESTISKELIKEISSFKEVWYFYNNQDFWRCKITQWWRIEKMCFVRTYCPWEFTSLPLGIEGQKKIKIFQNWKRYSWIFRSWLHQKPSQNPNIQRFHQTTRRMDGIQTPELFLRHDPSSQKINNPTIHHIR